LNTHRYSIEKKELISIGEFSNNLMRHPDITSTTSTTAMSIIARIRDVTPQQTAEAIKNIAKNICETSYKMREAVRAIRQSSAIDELTEAVREATIAVRDSAQTVQQNVSRTQQTQTARNQPQLTENIA
jgi:signal transduction histidine kinase